ncbi:uncharacterized protein LOC132558491 [Ylistrum balloti]|uniref:uncharacterized protein LOC132558491 n=1 Tax=Ylistrum balloti TaxID=509963 RepID=UPI002905DE66|nr:uncharacterized protein LOC132558491 [Ylistrum balloti]
MAALSLTYCRLRTGVERVARVLCSVHRLDRYTSSSKPCRRYQSSSSERIFDNRYLQANSTAHEHSDKFHLQHIRWSTRLKSEYREVWTENLILTLKKCLNQELKTTSYENILAAVIDLKSKVEDNKITFKLSAELGRELLEMITHTRHLSTVQKSTLTGLVWQILNLIQEVYTDKSGLADS